MTAIRRPARTAALAVLLAAAAPTAPAAPAAGFACDPTTSLVLVGMDTREGRLLLRAAGGPTGSPGWSLELVPSTDAGAGTAGAWDETALYHPVQRGEQPYGGSIGPGPIFGVEDCGTSCLQPVRWTSGHWEAFGDTVAAPDAATVHSTWDGRGRPWIVLQATGPGHGEVRAWAFRLEGSEWLPAGAQNVVASGSSEAVPDPLRDDAVRSGSGRFSAGDPPAPWLSSLPRRDPAAAGVLVPVGPGAAYVTQAGDLFLSDDGASWVRTRWTPWGRQPTRIWTPGTDYELDLAASDHRGSLPLVWFDRRRPEAHRLLLTEWTPAGDWRLLSELAVDVTTLDGEALPYSDFFVVRPDEWVLLTGCVHTPNGPGLVLRTFGSGGLSPARFLPLRPADPVDRAVPTRPLDE